MKKRTVWVMVALQLACLAMSARAEALREDRIARFLGGWLNDEYNLYIRLENNEIHSRLWHMDGDYIWEFDPCLYDAEEDRLYGPNYIRYREYIDWDSMELVQEDWALGDLGFTYFDFGEDEDTLIAVDIPNLDEPLTLRRVTDEEYFGF